jgi:hypothetical protein
MGCCECGDEPSGSCATELVSYVRKIGILVLPRTSCCLSVIVNIFSALILRPFADSTACGDRFDVAHVRITKFNIIMLSN